MRVPSVQVYGQHIYERECIRSKRDDLFGNIRTATRRKLASVDVSRWDYVKHERPNTIRRFCNGERTSACGGRHDGLVTTRTRLSTRIPMMHSSYSTRRLILRCKKKKKRKENELDSYETSRSYTYTAVHVNVHGPDVVAVTIPMTRVVRNPKNRIACSSITERSM